MMNQIDMMEKKYNDEVDHFNSQIEVMQSRNKDMVDTASNNSTVMKTLLTKIQLLEGSKSADGNSISNLKEELSILKVSSKLTEKENVSLKEELEATKGNLIQQSRVLSDAQ